MAPSAKVSSGSATENAGLVTRLPYGSKRDARLLCRSKCGVIVLDQRFHRDRARIEDRSRIEAEENGEHDERAHHRHLAPGKIGDVFERGLLQACRK
jgi:hypothetical protein